MIFAENLSAVGSLLKQQLPQLPPLPGQSGQAQLEKSTSELNKAEMTLDERIADQYARLEKHTQSGIDAVDKYTHFVRERQKIEAEYAVALKKLIKGYSPKKRDEETDFSTKTCFGKLLEEMTGIANQHELIADSLATEVVKDLQIYITELKKERNKHFHDAKQEEKSLNTSIKKLEQSKDAYRGAYNEFVRSKNQFHKVDEDVNQTKAQVEKCRKTMDSKNKGREDCKNEYILQLQQTNKDQRDYYSTKLPAVFQRIQEMDEKRINKLGEYFKKYADSHKRVLPLVGKCLDSIDQAGESVNATQDSNKVVERHKTGLVPPDDFEMVDLEGGQETSQIATSQSDNTSISSKGSIEANGGGTITGRTKGKRSGVLGSIFAKKDDDSSTRKIKIPHTSSFRKKKRRSLGRKKEEVKPKDDFSHLPPTQQKRELQKKIDGIQAEIDQEMKSKDALTKMRDVYTKNPALGDPNSTDKELATIGKKLDVLRLELQKYQKFMGYSPYRNNSCQSSGFMDQANGKPSVSTPQGTPHGTPHGTPVPDRAHPSEASPMREGSNGTGTSTGSEEQEQPSPTRPDLGQSFDDTDDPDFDEDVQPLWQAKAVYQFETDDPNLLGLAEGEVIDVLEEDDGDGWTRVRRSNEEGYVPTSYLVKV